MPRISMLALFLAACSPAGSAKIGGTTTTPAGTATGAATGTGTGTATGSTTTGACDVDAALTVDGLTAAPGPLPTMLELTVDLSAPAQAAVQCTADSDPEEIVFAESADAEGQHLFRLSGLTPSTDYTCTAAPICPTMAGPAASVAHSTGQPPNDLRPVSITVDPSLGMEGAWTMASFSTSAIGTQVYIVIWGPDGRVRWWHPLPSDVGIWIEARYHESTGEIVWGGGMDAEGRMRSVDLWEGETLAWAPAGWQGVNFHHDGKQLADGRMMSMEIRQNSAGPETWDGFGIRIWDPVTDAIDLDFDSQTLVDAGVLAVPGAFDNDPYHANWMDLADTVDGPEVVVSLCLSWQVVAFDAVTGDPRWLLSRGEGWTVLDEAGAPLSEDALPECQHGLEVANDRTLLVYDNGQGRNQSALQEWAIDPDTMTAQRLWSWTENGFNEPFLGDIDYLGTDRVLATAATMFGVSELIEVDRATGLVASRTSFDQGGATYRSERYAGCALFDSVRYCDDLAQRYDQVASLLRP